VQNLSSTAGTKDAKVKEAIKYPVELIDNSIKEIRLLSSTMVTPTGEIRLKELVQYCLMILKKQIHKTAFIYKVSNLDIDNDLK